MDTVERILNLLSARNESLDSLAAHLGMSVPTLKGLAQNSKDSLISYLPHISDF